MKLTSWTQQLNQLIKVDDLFFFFFRKNQFDILLRRFIICHFVGTFLALAQYLWRPFAL